MSKNEMSAAAESAAEGAIAWLEQIAGDWRQLDTLPTDRRQRLHRRTSVLDLIRFGLDASATAAALQGKGFSIDLRPDDKTHHLLWRIPDEQIRKAAFVRCAYSRWRTGARGRSRRSPYV